MVGVFIKTQRSETVLLLSLGIFFREQKDGNLYNNNTAIVSAFITLDTYIHMYTCMGFFFLPVSIMFLSFQRSNSSVAELCKNWHNKIPVYIMYTN
jgi:hypothetical protein